MSLETYLSYFSGLSEEISSRGGLHEAFLYQIT